MKKNNKGFMMAEVVVVASVVVVVVVSLYSSFNSLYKGYNERLKYNSLEGLYFASELEKLLIENLKINELATNIDGGSNYIDISNCQIGNVSDNNACTKLKNAYGVRNIYFTPYDVNNIKNDANFSVILSDYLKVINNEIPDTTKKYRLLIEMNDDSCTNLEIG